MTDNSAREAAKHQPSAAEMREEIKIDATLNQLGAAVVRGGAERKPSDTKEQGNGRTA